jgi:hypothetical protein
MVQRTIMLPRTLENQGDAAKMKWKEWIKNITGFLGAKRRDDKSGTSITVINAIMPTQMICLIQIEASHSPSLCPLMLNLDLVGVADVLAKSALAAAAKAVVLAVIMLCSEWWIR